MKRKKGLILDVFSTIGNFLGIDPWILRIIGLCLFNDIFLYYLVIGFIFSVFLDSVVDKREKEIDLEDTIKRD